MLKGSRRIITGAPIMAISKAIIARYLLRLKRILFLPFLTFEAQSHTTPSGQVYLHIHRYLKIIIIKVIKPNRFKITRPLTASTEFSKMNGLIHSNPPENIGKGIGKPTMIATMKNKYLTCPALKLIQGIHFAFSIGPEVS
jgi:hypothetical protein